MDDEEDSAPSLNLPEAWLVSDFMEVCPIKGYVPPLPSEIVREMPGLRKFIEAHPALLQKNVRRVLQQLILDMAVDNVQTDKFVEFGVFVLDRCAIEGVSQFFDRFNEESFINFIHNDLFKYLITGSEHATHLLREGIRKVWCSNDKCLNEGDYCCSRCMRKLNLRVFYCSRKCQKEHYPTHRQHCGKRHGGKNMCVHQLREEYMERIEMKYWSKQEEKAKPNSRKSAEREGKSKKGLEKNQRVEKRAPKEKNQRAEKRAPKDVKSGTRNEKSFSRNLKESDSSGANCSKSGEQPTQGKKAFKRGFLN